MRKIYILLIGVFFSGMSFGQTDGVSLEGDAPISQIERSVILKELYQQSNLFEENGTLEQILANRLAIKAAWQEVNPEIAALYKPLEGSKRSEFGVSEQPPEPIELKVRPEVVSARSIVANNLIRDDFVDGLDMDVNGAGDVYIACFTNEIEVGGSFDPLVVYRSEDHGETFSPWQTLESPTPIRQVKTIHFDGEGDDYFLVYVRFFGGLLQALRFKADTGFLVIQTISDNVEDFEVDRNFPVNTNSQRALMTYIKDNECETQVMSARSVPGTYGLEWQDEVGIDGNLCGAEVAITYGRGGACYASFVGFFSGNLYSNVNPSSNDPASWGAWVVVEQGADQEVSDITMKAAHKAIGEDEVVILTSAKPTGSTAGYNHRSYRRENGSAFSELWTGFALPNRSTAPMDTWIRREGDVDVIQASLTQDIIDDSSDDYLLERRYDGNDFSGGFSQMSDEGVDVWEYFAPAIAELQDNSVCMAFVGNNAGWPYGLYFEGGEVVLATEENNIDNLRYFPNPVEEVLTISTENPMEQIELFDVLGRSMMLVSPNKEEVQLMTADLQSGVYILKVKSNGKTGSYRVVKR